MKLDMHIHTKYSPCSMIGLKELRKKSGKIQVIPVITDHDEIIGNKRFSCPILASEISAKEGHILGYFITENIKKGMSAIETIEEIHSQGGLAAMAHPFDIFRDAVNNVELIKKADLIEGFNARVVKYKHNHLAFKLGRLNNIPITSASDAHTIKEFGKSYIDIEPFDSAKEFLKNLKRAKLFGKPSPRYVHICTKIHRILRKI